MTARTAASALRDGSWREWSPEAKRRLLERLQAERARALRSARSPYPWQRPHVHPDGFPLADGRFCTPLCDELPTYEPDAHDTILIYGGRGIGKTDGCAMYVLDHVDGPACDPSVPGGHRIAIIAPTIGDAVESCVNGPSGLRAYDPRVRAFGTREGTVARFPNGARARLLGAHTPEDVNRLRSAGNTCLVWFEEAAAQRHLGQAIEQVVPGLRVGERPHMIASTTPKARPEIKAWLKDESVIATVGRTEDAHHLDPKVREAMYRRLAGTRIGRQELNGDLLDDVDGALWRASMLRYVQPDAVPPLARVVVGLDPNAGGPDECGIVVVGIGRERVPDANGYMERPLFVLDDRSAKFTNPGEWAAAACQAYTRWEADAIVAEVNNGGDMVPHTIRVVNPTVRVVTVNATRGKVRRAEPVVALYEQGRVAHVGSFGRLEDQQTTWTEESDYSPDRMDALVWAITELAVVPDNSSLFAVV